MTSRTLLLAAASAASLLSSQAWAQPAETGEETLVEELVVTGARAPRTRLDTVSPVDVVSQQELSRQPTTEVAQALANVAPSINFPRPSITDGTDSVRPATLRGLSPDQTLVLVNSVRRHASALVNLNGSIGRGSSAVDLNTIPLAALSTVEVLRDGASAQYGSDAIAGVINLRLREAREGGGVSLHMGQYFTEVKTARIPQGYDKQDGAVVEVSGWKGLPLGPEGFLTVTAEYRDRQPTGRSDLDPREAPAVIRGRYGDAEVKDATIFFNAGHPLNAVWSAYGWLGFQHREAQSAATARIPSNPNNDLTVYPNGFLPIIAPDIDDLSTVVGLRGEVSGFEIDANLGYGKSKIDYRVERSINGSLVPNSPTSFDAGNLSYEQTTLGVDVLKPLEFGGFEAVNFAFGAEYRDERYQIGAGEEASWIFVPGRPGAGAGSQGFIGFRPSNETDRSRHSIGAYADLDLQVTEAFDIDFAARYEDYSDFGEKTTYKVAARYDLTDSFAIRGSASTGFRAPALQQQAFTSTAINFILISSVSTPVEIATLPPSDPIAQSLGATPLRPEESENYTLGLVYRRGPFELTVDAYRINIDDRIVLSENLTGNPTGTATEVAIYNLLNPTGGTLGGARFFINGVDSETEGLDIVARYRMETKTFGRFNFVLAANFNETSITRVPAIPTSVPIPNPPSLFNRINVVSFEEGTPHTKVSFSTDWNRGPWSMTGRSTYYESVIHPFSNAGPASDVHTGDKFIIDWEGRRRFGDSLAWAVGVNNLFDEYPDYTPASINTSGATPFSNYSPFGFNGRFVYTRLTYDF